LLPKTPKPRDFKRNNKHYNEYWTEETRKRNRQRGDPERSWSEEVCKESSSARTVQGEFVYKLQRLEQNFARRTKLPDGQKKLTQGYPEYKPKRLYLRASHSRAEPGSGGAVPQSKCRDFAKEFCNSTSSPGSGEIVERQLAFQSSWRGAKGELKRKSTRQLWQKPEDYSQQTLPQKLPGRAVD